MLFVAKNLARQRGSRDFDGQIICAEFCLCDQSRGTPRARMAVGDIAQRLHITAHERNRAYQKNFSEALDRRAQIAKSIQLKYCI
jgi:hypothetical protein